jgi:type IV secretion system protein TrbB
MMARYLGPAVTRAFADDDVTEVYVNPQDGCVRTDTRSRGKVDTGHRLDASRVEMFLNAVAAHLGTTLGAEHPRLEAELPLASFGGSRLQGFISPLAQGPCFTIRKPPAVVYSLDDFVGRACVRRHIATCCERPYVPPRERRPGFPMGMS